MIDRYDWAGGQEAMLRFGPLDGPVVVFAQPLFEEANRTRALIVSVARALARRRIASAIPDLPGTGESLVPTRDVTIMMMREAFEGAAARFDREGRETYGAGIRSGALLDPLALLSGRWHLAPVDGARVLRELTRIKQIEVDHSLNEFWYLEGDTAIESGHSPVAIAGNLVSPHLLSELTALTPFDQPDIPRRVVRLDSDPEPADVKLPGPPLWRRAEPDNDRALVELLADDLTAWVRSCEG
ncbi:hypothetical protein [Sphingomonas sp.]|uniref:hypothetical protein n=1 Tax=Sphingomonas sp. TaxID=28214 RepID=UPI002C8EA026|nr:hypothetical protein [Sphingomonas sp.]HWK36514.1 hypothetical protein [Sphingomonas sp.]